MRNGRGLPNGEYLLQEGAASFLGRRKFAAQNRSLGTRASRIECVTRVRGGDVFQFGLCIAPMLEGDACESQHDGGPVVEPGKGFSPFQVDAKAPRHPMDGAQLKRDAEKIEKLAQGLPAEMDMVGKGQLPKDLLDRLKSIEKLAKKPRGELSH